MTIKTDDAAVTETQASAEGEPKKLLLGKRVLRHFNVKSSIQTGAGPANSLSTRLRCRPPGETDGSIAIDP